MSWYEELDKWAADYLPDMEYEKDAPLDRYTSFRIGGPARRMAFPRSGEAAVLLVSHALELGARPFVLGNGTNVLFPDEGVERLVICTRDMAGVAAGAVAGEITAECGASLAKIAVFAQKAGLSGLEFAHGIPGSLGGAVCMNAGAYGGEMKDVLKWVKVLDNNGEMKTLKAEELELGYRTSIIVKEKMIVLEACIELHEGNRDEIEMHMKELMAKRKEKQPLEYPSAGSTFKRPKGYFAGKLIQDAGLKGYRVGGAMVSEKHSGFVINYDNATATDIINLMKDVRKKVYEEFQVTLEPEVKILPAVKW